MDGKTKWRGIRERNKGEINEGIKSTVTVPRFEFKTILMEKVFIANSERG